MSEANLTSTIEQLTVSPTDVGVDYQQRLEDESTNFHQQILGLIAKYPANRGQDLLGPVGLVRESTEAVVARSVGVKNIDEFEAILKQLVLDRQRIHFYKASCSALKGFPVYDSATWERTGSLDSNRYIVRFGTSNIQ